MELSKGREEWQSHPDGSLQLVHRLKLGAHVMIKIVKALVENNYTTMSRLACHQIRTTHSARGA